MKRAASVALWLFLFWFAAAFFSIRTLSDRVDWLKFQNAQLQQQLALKESEVAHAKNDVDRLEDKVRIEEEYLRDQDRKLEVDEHLLKP